MTKPRLVLTFYAALLLATGLLAVGRGQPATLSVAARESAAVAPGDPFRRCAVKVLRGDYGKQADWKLNAYRRGLEQGITVKGTALVTWYGPPEKDAIHDAHGKRCTMRTAANNQYPQYAYLWIDGPHCTMRQIRDTGSWENVRVAKRRGRSTWVDIWHTRKFEVHAAKFAVIPAGEGKL